MAGQFGDVSRADRLTSHADLRNAFVVTLAAFYLLAYMAGRLADALHAMPTATRSRSQFTISSLLDLTESTDALSASWILSELGAVSYEVFMPKVKKLKMQRAFLVRLDEILTIQWEFEPNYQK